MKIGVIMGLNSWLVYCGIEGKILGMLVCSWLGEGGKPRFSLGSQDAPRPSLGAPPRVWPFWPSLLSDLGARRDLLGQVATCLSFGMRAYSLTWDKS